MNMSSQEFCTLLGLDEPLYPGQIKKRRVKNPKEGASFTVVYDWKTNPKKIVVEVVPGLTDRPLSKEDLKKVPVILQAPTRFEADIIEGAA